MKDFPHPSYHEVFEKYLNQKLREKLFRERDYTTAGYFFQTVAAYKDEKSYELLEKCWKMTSNCLGDSAMIKEELAEAIWDNRCELYARFIPLVKPIVEEQLKRSMKIERDYSDTVGLSLKRWDWSVDF
jgi:hypothetical protein